MDRFIVEAGEQIEEEDMLKTNKNTYIALSKIAQAILGSGTLLNGFTCVATGPASMGVSVSAGEIYQMAAVDTTPYGDLPTDAHQILKQGINLDPTTNLAFAAPVTVGQSVNYLIQMALQEVDILPENREFFGGSPQVVNTIRQDSVLIQAIAGTPATTGSQVTPTPTTGFVGAFIVTVAYGQTTITGGNIAAYPNAPFITNVLGNMLTLAQADARYSQLSMFGNLFQAVKGYQLLPPAAPGAFNGLIQWGNDVVPSGGFITINYPIAFPNGTLAAYATANAAVSSAIPISASVAFINNTSFDLYNHSGAAVSICWQVIGY